MTPAIARRRIDILLEELHRSIAKVDITLLDPRDLDEAFEVIDRIEKALPLTEVANGDQ